MTLGYGEFYPVVFAAKGFVCLYMMVFLGMVSSALPEVIPPTSLSFIIMVFAFLGAGGHIMLHNCHHCHYNCHHDLHLFLFQVVDIMLAKPKFAIPYLPEDRPFIVVSHSHDGSTNN